MTVWFQRAIKSNFLDGWTSSVEAAVQVTRGREKRCDDQLHTIGNKERRDKERTTEREREREREREGGRETERERGRERLENKRRCSSRIFQEDDVFSQVKEKSG